MSLFCVSTININIDTCTIFRMTINWSDRIKQLLGKGREMKRLVTKKKHAVQDEAFELGLRHREVREAERQLSWHQLNPQWVQLLPA